MTARSSVHGAEPRRARLNRLAWLLDSSIRVPGTNFRIGLDALLGLLPGGGDAAGVLLSSYIVLEAARMGAPRRTLFLMLLNVAVEALVGAIPLAGDLFDAAWKANQRNVALLNAWLGVPGTPPAQGWLPVLLVLAALLGLLVLTVALAVAVIYCVAAALAAP
jgi:hypothetical protein